MNSERQILKRLLEGCEEEFNPNKKEELEEASFEAGGKTYKCAFGRYSCDGEPISRDEYMAAKEGGASAPSSSGSRKEEPKKAKSSGWESVKGDAYTSWGKDYPTGESATLYQGDGSDFSGYSFNLTDKEGNQIWDKSWGSEAPTFKKKEDAQNFIDNYLKYKNGEGPKPEIPSEKPKKLSSKVGGAKLSSTPASSFKNGPSGLGYNMSKDYTEDMFIKDMEAAGYKEIDGGYESPKGDFLWYEMGEEGNPQVYLER